ncbi:MAG: ice-binding family protein [Chitinophagaceae bacterium]|nr:ice-binding family protein [Chitinophagaceae bacterium]
MKKMLLKIISVVTFFAVSISTQAQAPTLGTSANFVLFTTVGAVTNSGISQLTGNVGTNSGSSTGFGNVNGVMHDNDGASGQAAIDVLLAYNQLNNSIPNFFPAPLLGNGDTLVAGNYKTTAVTSLIGTLYLNAKGDANAVFIFQVQAAFSTGTGAKVKLLNGAQACNVFWKIEGAVNMASLTSFKGTIIAHNAAINMSTSDTLEGRALSIAGAVTTNGVMAYTPIGCGSPRLTGPAAPAMNTTACYAVFSGNGSVTNSGTTHVTGDVGTNVGLTTGFDALLVNGTIHPIPDVSTAACAAELLNVYNYLNVLPFDIELLYPAQFGNNLVLTPHTYLMNAATAFTDTVYLNAQGNVDAVFVILINGALTTSTFSKVILTNGAQAKNVFWKVEGAVNINDYSVFAGTIVCNNGAINLSTGDSINGRAFTTNGTLRTKDVVVTMTEGCKSLPVTWLSFTAEKTKQSSVLLKWSTASEANNDRFEIERSGDGTNFTMVGTVAAGSNASLVQNYSFNNTKTLNGTSFYRLKQVDRNGTIKYSAIVKISFSGAVYSVFPNPATNKTTIQVRSLLNKVSVSLVNNSGMIVYRSTYVNVAAGSTIDIPLQNLPKGIYLLKLDSETGRSSEKIILQ